jgi:radical SAM protein with 4Fe4S-binding SPASM domain
MRHKFSCLVCSQGDVMPCVGVNIPIGNIRERKLYDIIKDSEILQDLTDHLHTIKGPCRSCEKADMCYGCRGAAYQLTGDYLASDPLCWRNANRQDEIARLPFAAAEIIPQKPPMRVIDALLAVGDRSGEVSATVSDEMPFVGEDGILAETTYLELMAQSIAAVNGFKQLGGSGSSLEGYLVGAQELEILGTARVGDKLNISVRKEARYNRFAIVKGTVSRDGELLARGEIKIWHDAVRSGQDPASSGS